MTTLFSRGGAGDYEIQAPLSSTDNNLRLFRAVNQLLEQRGQKLALTIMQEHPFEIYEATNSWNDEFNILYRKAPLMEYENLRLLRADRAAMAALRVIAETFGELNVYIRFIGVCLDLESEIQPVTSPEMTIDIESVDQALKDAVILLRDARPVSAMDRIHTALHGYLLQICTEAGIPIEGKDPNTSNLFGQLRKFHPALQPSGPRQEDITIMYRSMAAVIGVLESLRNRTSVAHPNPDLLGDAEAMLYINSVRTLLHFLSDKI